MEVSSKRLSKIEMLDVLMLFAKSREFKGDVRVL